MKNEDFKSSSVDAEQNVLQELLKQTQIQLKSAERTLRRLRHDNESLGAMYESAIHLKEHNEREKDRQYMYNRLLLDVFPSIIAVLDGELCYVLGTANQIMQYFGFRDAMELTGLSLSAILNKMAAEDWVQKTIAQCWHVLQTSQKISYTDFVVFKNGLQLHVNITITPAIDKNSVIQGVVFLMDDVTELVKTKEAAEQAAHAKTSFLANMSHELRTPMNAILGMGHLLNSTALSETQQDYLNNLLRASDSLLEIINDILDFSKIDAQRFEIVNLEYNLTDPISDVLNIVRFRAEEKALALIIDLDPNLPCRLKGDAIKIKQVLVNVLTNAIKYTKSGSVCLSVHSELQDDCFYLVFSVTDTGIGIQEDNLSHLFNAFTQVDRKKNLGTEGTGLGLAITKGLLNAMHGDITVESEYGKGSTFTLTLPQIPLDTTPIASVTDPEEMRVLLAGTGLVIDSIGQMLTALHIPYDAMSTDDDTKAWTLEGYTHVIFLDSMAKDISALDMQHQLVSFILVSDTESMRDKYSGANLKVLYKPVMITELANILNGSNQKNTEKQTRLSHGKQMGTFHAPNAYILLVDDNEINLLVAEEILKQYHLNVISARSGKEALSALKSHSVDLILMDHMMPGMDGVETTRQIRLMGGKYKSLPIIALTANAIGDVEKFYLNNQMNGFLSKPIDIDKLAQVLLEWLPKDKIR